MENEDTETKQVRISDALLAIERKLAFARDYQAANIVQAAIAYIEKLEKDAEPTAPAEEIEPVDTTRLDSIATD